MVLGEAGVGKSSLVRHWLSEIDQVTLLQVRADPDERAVDLATADQLLRDARGRVTPFPDVATRRVTPRSAFDVGADLLAAFGDAQDKDPVVVFVDDLHWVDAASLSALGFAVRRLRRDKVMVIASGLDSELPEGADCLLRLARSPTGGRIVLGGLTLTDTATLAHSLVGHRVDTAVVEDLHRATRGNPLWLRSVLRHAPLQLLAARRPLAVAPSLCATLRAQVNRCTQDARQFLLALSVLEGQQPIARVAELAGTYDVWAALDAALGSGLVECVGEPPNVYVSFTHPVMASAIAESLSYQARHDLHSAAVASSTSTTEALRHQVACAFGPDRTLGARVLEHGRALAARGSMLESSVWLGQAAALADDPGAQDALRLEAAHAALAGGCQAAAVAALAAPPALPSGYRDFLTAWLAWLRGDIDTARSLSAAARGCGDTRARSGAAFLMAQVELLADRGAEAVRWAQRAESSGDLITSSLARAGRGAGLLIQGNPESCLELFGPRTDDVEPLRITQEGVRGLALIHLDRPDEARVALTAAVTAVRRHRHFNLASMPLANLGMLENRTGNWAAAGLALEEALAYSETFGESWGLAVIHSLAALAPARRGDFATAQASVDAATAQSGGGESGRIYAAVAAVHLAHARGDTADLIDAGSWLADRPDTSGAWLPGLFQWAAPYVEALCECGRTPTADSIGQRIAAKAASSDRPSGQAEAAWARARMAAVAARHGDAVHAYGEAACLYDSCGMPFEAALARMNRGLLLRDIGDDSPGIDELTRAGGAFDQLGAVPYRNRVRSGLAADPASPLTALTRPNETGAREAGRPTSANPLLSAQESIVARLVASGQSNREVAAEMCLSVRTVEFHLASIFRKLGVRSRTQLVALILTTDPSHALPCNHRDLSGS